MTLKDLIYKGIETISALYPEGEAREMVFAYLEDTIGTKRHTHILEPEYSVPESVLAKASADFGRMAQGEPLQYVTGKAWFCGREFKVSPSVLIPRQETEMLPGLIPSGAARALDLCTGSGCIAWTIALDNPGMQVVAVDLSAEALEVASSQVFLQEPGSFRPQFIAADVLDSESLVGTLLSVSSDGFDIIVSNPPYVRDSEKALMRTNVLDHEPHLALFVSDDDPLVFYRAVARCSAGLLSTGGTGVVEINEAFGRQTAGVFTEAGFNDVEIIQDLHGRDRFVRYRR